MENLERIFWETCSVKQALTLAMYLSKTGTEWNYATDIQKGQILINFYREELEGIVTVDKSGNEMDEEAACLILNREGLAPAKDFIFTVVSSHMKAEAKPTEEEYKNWLQDQLTYIS